MVKLPTRFDGSVILMLLVAGTRLACGKARAKSEWATFEMAGNRVGTNFVSAAGGGSKGSCVVSRWLVGTKVEGGLGRDDDLEVMYPPLV